MPLIYKEPKWEHKKEFTRPMFGGWEKEIVMEILKEIPYGSEIKITFQWSRNQIKKDLEEFEKKYLKKSKVKE